MPVRLHEGFEDLISDRAKSVAISPKGTSLFSNNFDSLTILDNDDVDQASSNFTPRRINVDVVSKNILSDDLTTPCIKEQRSRAIPVNKWNLKFKGFERSLLQLCRRLEVTQLGVESPVAPSSSKSKTVEPHLA
ncbi:hypothetical protein FQA39_LY17265 [Lamprigera yunnana]|nr:hypothetical protein FQA39_LY17265 [Lamprigera yunnana]